jgi:hypothetical protein
MLYWNEIIKDLAKILTCFCSTCVYIYMTKLQMFYVWAFVTRQISIRQSNSVQTDLSLFCKHLQQLLCCQGRWRGADVRKECLEANFHISSTLLRKLCVHYANGFDNAESVYLFCSNPV